MKHRKVYYHIEKALKVDAYGVIILMGLRKTGKTTILKQLAESYHGHYIDFRNSNDPEKDYLDVYNSEAKLILLDEIGYLPDFDAFFDTLEVDIKQAGKKVVITSSSYGSLKQLSRERLGGGRSYSVEIFPICFEEYLFFTDKISFYGQDYDPTAEDVQNFYRLRDMPMGMEFIIDKRYMLEIFNDAEVARANHQYAIRDIFLTGNQYISVIDILAYSLNEAIGVKRFGGTRVGRQEFGACIGTIDLSRALISYANRESLNMTAQELSQIIAYLIHAGFVFTDLIITEKSKQNSDRIVSDLLEVRNRPDLQGILERYTLSVISPLIYTRLLVDLEDIMDKAYTNKSLSGKIYELAVKAEDFHRKSYVMIRNSYKYSTLDAEVDLISDNLLLEATVSYKNDDKQYVDKIFKDKPLIRVLTDEPGVFEDTGNYHRIGYPKALLMLSNGSMYRLKATAVKD